MLFDRFLLLPHSRSCSWKTAERTLTPGYDFLADLKAPVNRAASRAVLSATAQLHIARQARGGDMRAPARTSLHLATACGLAAGLLIIPTAALRQGALPAFAAQGRAPRPGQWTQVTTPLTLIDDVGLARGADGVLHVLWTTGSTGHLRVSDTPVSASGVVGRPVTIASSLFSATDPDATVTSAGLAAFWDEVKTSAPSSPTGIFEATRPSRGGAWHLAGVTSTPFDWLSSVAVAPGTRDAPWVDFEDSAGIAVHHAGFAVRQLAYPACCVTQEGIGTDSATGTTWATYVSDMPKHSGLFAQRLTDAGQRSGPPVLFPGSGGAQGSLTVEQRVTATGLDGRRPGVYVVYRTGGQGVAHHLELFRLGARSAVSLASFTLTDEIGGSTLAADPFGRLWVAWFRVIDNRPVLFVRRAKAGASDFGSAEKVPVPGGTAAITKVYINAQSKRLDVVALLTRNGKTAYWTTQVLPPRP
jgi:hypothetical protein